MVVKNPPSSKFSSPGSVRDPETGAVNIDSNPAIPAGAVPANAAPASGTHSGFNWSAAGADLRAAAAATVATSADGVQQKVAQAVAAQQIQKQSPILRGFPEPFEHWDRQQLNDDVNHYTQDQYRNEGDDSDLLNMNMYG